MKQPQPRRQRGTSGTKTMKDLTPKQRIEKLQFVIKLLRELMDEDPKLNLRVTIEQAEDKLREAYKPPVGIASRSSRTVRRPMCYSRVRTTIAPSTSASGSKRTRKTKANSLLHRIKYKQHGTGNHQTRQQRGGGYRPSAKGAARGAWHHGQGFMRANRAKDLNTIQHRKRKVEHGNQTVARYCTCPRSSYRCSQGLSIRKIKKHLKRGAFFMPMCQKTLPRKKGRSDKRSALDIRIFFCIFVC